MLPTVKKVIPGAKDGSDWNDSCDRPHCHNSGWSVLSFPFQTVVADAFGDDDDSSDQRGKSGHQNCIVHSLIEGRSEDTAETAVVSSAGKSRGLTRSEIHSNGSLLPLSIVVHKISTFPLDKCILRSVKLVASLNKID